jgi:hypothetical protein
MMGFLSKIFDFMFAPAGTFDPASNLYIASNDSGYESSSGDETGMTITEINPATGLPMIDGIGSVDVGGSPWFQDIHHRDDFCSANDSIFNHDCGSMFDHSSSSFNCSSVFDTGISSTDFGCKFD